MGAEVKVGPAGPGQIVMDERGYTATAASIGGGSVGANDFGLHDESCDPPNRAEVTAAFGSGLDSIRLRHYGPIQMVGVAPVPVIIERRPCAGGSYSPLVATDFEYVVDPLDPNSLVSHD